MNEGGVLAQVQSGGVSTPAITGAALAAAQPQPGLRWLDIGCGRGDLLRAVLDEWQPAELVGIDAIDWLGNGLRQHMEFMLGSPAISLEFLGTFNRVLMIDAIEHLDDPSSTL